MMFLMSLHNYYSVLDGFVNGECDISDSVSASHGMELINLCDVVMGCEDIIFEIISNSPWLLSLSIINKTLYKVSQRVIRMTFKIDFVELCRQNHYLTIRHLLIRYTNRKCHINKYKKYGIMKFTSDSIKKYNNNEFMAYEFDSFHKYNEDIDKYEFDYTKKTILDNMISALVAYSSANFLVNGNVYESIERSESKVSEGLRVMLYNKNNEYTNYMINKFKVWGSVTCINMIQDSLRAQNGEAYMHIVNTYPESFKWTMTTWIFYTANIDIINFYLKIKNSTDPKIKRKYCPYSGPMRRGEWQDALYCSLAMDHYDGVILALEHTTGNDSGVGCDSIKIKDPRIKNLVKDIECSVCGEPMGVHFV